MRKILQRIGTAVSISTALMLLVTIVSPTEAKASGYTFDLEFSSAQVDEMTLIYPNDVCPSGPSPYDMFWTRGVFTDSSNQVFSDLDIGTTQSNGDWTSAKLIIPDGASLGLGSFYLVCSSTPDLMQCH